MLFYAGDIILIDPPPTALVRDVKPMIAAATGIASEAQQLKLNGKVLEDTRTLDEQRVAIGATVNLEIKPGIFITLKDGRKIPINCVSTDTVDKIKRKLQGQTGLVPNELSCNYGGRSLLNHSTLADQKVPFGANIHCTPKPTVLVQIPGRDLNLSMTALDIVEKCIRMWYSQRECTILNEFVMDT